MADKKRNFILVNTKAQIDSLLREHIESGTLFLKGEKKKEVKVLKILENNIMVVEGKFETKNEEKILLFKIMARYMEIHTKLVKQTAGTTKVLQVEKILIANDARKFKRYPVLQNQAYITNCKIPKINLDFEHSLRSTVVSIAFSVFTKRLKEYADVTKIELIDKDKPIDVALAREAKAVLVANTSDPASYQKAGDRFLDYATVLGKNIQKKILSSKSKEIISEIYMPILNIRKNRKPNVIGYMYLGSRNKTFTKEFVEEVRGISFELMDYIRESNSTVIKEKQAVQDISIQGMSIRIDSKELKDFLIEQSGFRFDLVVRHSSAVTLFAILNNMKFNNDGSLLLGVSLPKYSNNEDVLKKYHEKLKLHLERLAKEGR